MNPKLQHNLIIGAVIVLMAGFAYYHLFIHSKNISSHTEATQHEHEHGNNLNNPATGLDLTDQNELTINIKDFAYSPSNLKVKKGTKVTWVNQDTMQHNVMREHEHSEEAHAAPTKEEVRADVFAGPLLNQGESYSFTFNQIGEFPYHCAPHPYMTGLVIVTE